MLVVRRETARTPSASVPAQDQAGKIGTHTALAGFAEAIEKLAFGAGVLLLAGVVYASKKM
ncbi:MAG: hypothetical protein ACYDC6_02710 [Acidobacteriaceae bacterium]